LNLRQPTINNLRDVQYDSLKLSGTSATATKMMIGNAVPPIMAKEVISAVLKAA